MATLARSALNRPNPPAGVGIGGALTMRDADAPTLMFYIQVDDINDAMASVERAGGRRLTEQFPIPGVGWSAFFADSEANRVGLFQPDPGARLPGA
jgi:predicted enzyme related to lactoylglutathione lyase